jgi:hypothetical protein
MPVPSPLEMRAMAYRVFVHSMQRQGITVIQKGMLKSNPVIQMIYRTPARFADALMEMEALGMLIKNGRGWSIKSDTAALVCCICGKPLAGDCVQDSEKRLAHAECADGAIEENTPPVCDARI